MVRRFIKYWVDLGLVFHAGSAQVRKINWLRGKPKKPLGKRVFGSPLVAIKGKKRAFVALMCGKLALQVESAKKCLIHKTNAVGADR